MYSYDAWEKVRKFPVEASMRRLDVLLNVWVSSRALICRNWVKLVERLYMGRLAQKTIEYDKTCHGCFSCLYYKNISSSGV